MTMESYEPAKIGIAEIDEQHEEFFMQLSLLRVALIDGIQGQTKVNDTLHYLETFVQEHFETEERLMALHQYPYLQHHRQEHANFVQTIAAIRQRALEAGSDSSAVIAVEIEQRLGQWLLGHIATVDRMMGEFLEGKI
ncbi:MAG: bacteriohemerythrin [Nitrospiraceae bacterium]|nr:bacteriohemerythrin [Nitrospiraceae bacterium]